MNRFESLSEAYEALDGDRTIKGYALEEVAYAYYASKYDTVIMTNEYDNGIDLILFNENNRMHRIGVQVKNQQGYVTKNQIIKMIDRSYDYYGLSEIWLLSTSEVKYSAQYLIDKYNIKVIDQKELLNIIDFSKKQEFINTYSLREELFETINMNNGFYGVYDRFPRETIIEILEKKPKTKHEFSKITGIGPVRLERHWEDITDLFK